MPNYSLNFSRSASQVYLQYYNFLCLDHQGYTRIMSTIIANARFLERWLMRLGRFDLLTDTNYLPVVVVKLRDDSTYTVFQICEIMRERGWTIPAYTLPPDAQEEAVLRLVVKENFSRDMAEILATDMENAVHRLEADRTKGRHPGAKKKHQTR